jgi:hypothetical protein
MTDRYSSFEIPQDDKRQIVDHHGTKTVFPAHYCASRRSCSQPAVGTSIGIKSTRRVCKTSEIWPEFARFVKFVNWDYLERACAAFAHAVRGHAEAEAGSARRFL